MKIKKIVILLIFMLSLNLATAQQIIIPIENMMATGPIFMPKTLVLDSTDINNNKINNELLLKQSYSESFINAAKYGDTLKIHEQTVVINKQAVDKKGFIITETKTKESVCAYFFTYIKVKNFLDISINIESNNDVIIEVYGKKTEYFKVKKDASESKKIDLKLEADLYKVSFKFLNNNSETIKFKSYISVASNNKDFIEIKDNPTRTLNLRDLYSGENVNSVYLSPSGDFALVNYTRQLGEGKTESWTNYCNMLTDYSIPFSPAQDATNFTWGKDDFEIYYTRKNDKSTAIWKFDFKSGENKLLLDGLKNFSLYRLAPNKKYIIYALNDEPTEDKNVMKKIEGMEARQKQFWSRTQYYYLDLYTLASERLIFGKQEISLMDISNDSKDLLFSISYPDYEKSPFTKQTVFMYNLENREKKYLWKDNPISINASFSPDNTQLLCTAGPEAFNSVGLNIPEGMLANNYDTQAYIYNISSGSVQAITKNFKPTISAAYWNLYDNLIYFLVQEGTYKNLYKYNPVLKIYEKYNLNEDIILSLSLSEKSAGAAYIGQSSQNNNRAYKLNLQTKKYSLFSAPYDKYAKDIKYGKIEDFNFVNSNNDTIEGRIQYPVDFDTNKKYPVIVYYYGGTSPVSRNFDGKYPFDIYNSNDYIVYCLQPSGTIGYGQKFSALHVNAWGKTTADDIIEGTKKMLESHPFCNPKKVACIGASYGGFMTMYLLTKTDIFACGISHAGISSISSYWGEGYWGYLYSAEATKNSYPWNNQKLYTEQSPLFNADKVNTPLLLLHGDRDTNVPPGESIQFYTALKILGKDVEFILIEDTDHGVQKYEQRVKWNNTILAWFDKYLKDNPSWWNELYPKK